MVAWVASDLQVPEEYLNESIFPKVYDWRARFMTALEEARSQAPPPVKLEGPEAVEAVLGADFSDNDLFVDAGDPIKVENGTTVELFPTDSGGFTHKDQGQLVKLTKDEVAIAVRSEKGEKDVHVHAPRWNFKIQEVGDSRL